METELIFEGDLGSVFSTTAETGEGGQSTEIIVEGIEEASEEVEHQSIIEEHETIIDGEHEAIMDDESETIIDGEQEGMMHEESETIIDGDPETIIDGDPETIIDGDPETIIDGDPETIIDGDPETIIDGDPETIIDGESEHIMECETDPDTEAAVAGIPVTMNVSLEDEGLGQELIDANVVEEDIMGQIPLMAPAPIADRPDTEISTEDELKSTERLDRSSPDLWPQNLPSAAHHIIAKNASKTGEPEANLGIWAQGLDPEDINLLHQFGSLTSSSLVEEVKKLQNIAYQLGLEESKEMTRGKLLHVLDEDELTSKKEKESHVQRLWK